MNLPLYNDHNLECDLECDLPGIDRNLIFLAEMHSPRNMSSLSFIVIIIIFIIIFIIILLLFGYSFQVWTLPSSDASRQAKCHQGTGVMVTLTDLAMRPNIF